MSMNNDNKDLNDLLKTASNTLGTDPDKIKKEAGKNGLSGLLNNLTPEQAKRVQSLLSDKEATAKALSKKIDTGYDRILELLNKDAYQVEFGTSGKNLSQLEMEKIKNLELPGIDFIKSTKRYYPNGDFASYLLGYTKNKEDEDGNKLMVGELGIEGYYNEKLTGKNGYLKYEKDGRGNKIANSNEYMEVA